MQKIMQWVLAATLICGASVMTSCSSSEDNAAQGDGHTKKALLVILDGWGIGDKSEADADHAINDDGTPNTTHSTNPVPFIYVTDSKSVKVQGGALCDVAPSILHIMGLPQPGEMTGKCLIQE